MGAAVVEGTTLGSVRSSNTRGCTSGASSASTAKGDLGGIPGRRPRAEEGGTTCVPRGTRAAACTAVEVIDATENDEVVVCAAGAVVAASSEVVGDVTVRAATPAVTRDAAPVVSGSATPRGTSGVNSSGGTVTC